MVENPILSMRNLKTYFYTDKGIAPAVDGVSIDINKGEIVGLVGESGCGKSVTAMSILQLIEKPGKIVDGEIIFNGEDLLTYSKSKMRTVRGNKISMIFQEPMTSLNPVYRVGGQVAEAILLHNKKTTKQEAKEIVINMFNHVGIPEPEKRYNAYPHQLSGGLRQRVMIAMALVCKSNLLIADEPTTALDVTIEAQILDLMKSLQKQIGTSIILITHNLGVVAEMCDYVYVMYAGNIMEQADVYELFDNPMHPYTEGLLKSLPKVDEESEKKDRLYSIRGMVPSLLNLPKGCKFSPRCEYVMDICREENPELIEVSKGHKVRCFKYQK